MSYVARFDSGGQARRHLYFDEHCVDGRIDSLWRSVAVFVLFRLGAKLACLCCTANSVNTLLDTSCQLPDLLRMSVLGSLHAPCQA
jgi:hypothetical protein